MPKDIMMNMDDKIYAKYLIVCFLQFLNNYRLQITDYRF